jgi:ABC-type Zn uptake system ZnuABC Zn-binding protein ZnuA
VTFHRPTLDPGTGRRGLVAVLVGLWAIGAAGGDAPLPVMTTSTDLKALVEAVGGERVRVESLSSPLQDPEAIELTPEQIARLREAALLIRVGLDYEPWLARALMLASDTRLVAGSPHFLDTSTEVALLQTEPPRGRGKGTPSARRPPNAYYWLDPENARPLTAAILRALVGLIPADRPRFEANRQRFLQRLDARLARWRSAMAPYKGTRVVVVHDSWPYFARRFGLVVTAWVETTPGVPPPPATLAALSRRMRETGVRLLIAEPYSSEAIVQQLVARSGARTVTLVPSVGAEPTITDYFAIFDVNIARLTSVLGKPR